MQNLLKIISAACGIAFTRYSPVSGGDINASYCLYTSDNRYFLKVNDAARFPSMFAMEADGLNTLRNGSTLIVPQVIKKGLADKQQWLLLQWIEKGSPHKNSITHFGTALAAMHRKPQPYFGWPADNYIGSLHQINTQHNNWTEFYTQCRVMPLVKTLFDDGAFSKNDTDNASSFCKNMANLFPEETPALLHGDLWGGNYMIDSNGNPVIFDPAVYCGHREMDLGMTRLFGGFNQSFYDAYDEHYPLENGWQQRLYLTQLYPLLVHAVLFGGHYIMNVKDIMRKF